MPVRLVEVSIKDIQGFLPDIKELVAETAVTMYASCPDDFSVDAVIALLDLHPIQLVKNDGALYVVAGFRGFELASLILSEEHPLRCFLHEGLSQAEAEFLATVDILGSAMMHSLGAKYVQQLQTLAKGIGPQTKTIFPKTKSIRRIDE
jgi:hypothetical protein